MSGNQAMDTYMSGRDERFFGSLSHDGIEETILIPFALVQKIIMENTINY